MQDAANNHASPCPPKLAAQLDAWFLQQLVNAQGVWLHACYRAILPEALYDRAARGEKEGLREASDYARKMGYRLHRFEGRSELRRGEKLVAEFNPQITGEGESRHLELHAHILGQPVDLLALMRGTKLDPMEGA